MTDSANQNAQQDNDAVIAVKGGDAERYRELVERHERRVYAVAWSRLGDAALAEEVTQETFIRAYRRLWLLGEGAKFSGWVNTIARRIAINLGIRHRRELDKRKRWVLENPEPSAADNSFDESGALYTPETLRQTLAELPDAHRECLVLFYIEGKNGSEAATVLGISEAALRIRLLRARAAMRERLEKKLEGSLMKLGPAKTLVPAVMAGVLVSSSAKAATAGGTVAAGFGAKILSLACKTVLFSWLWPLISLVAMLPSLGFAWLFGRMERRNFRDADGFRSTLHQKFFRSFIWGFPLVFVLMVVIIPMAFAKSGIAGLSFYISGFLVLMTLVSARSLVIACNPYQISMFFYCLILTVGTSAAAMGWIPPALSQLPMLIATTLLVLVFKKRPSRMDYSLLLRASQGLLKSSDDERKGFRSKGLQRPELFKFARFLGSQYLVANFSRETNGLVLRLPPVENHFLTNMASLLLPPISQDCSYISLGLNGTVLAHCGTKDSASLSELKTARMTDPRELENLVEETVMESWEKFRSEKISEAEKILGNSPEAEVFRVSPARSRSAHGWQILLAAAVALMAAAMAMQLFIPRQSSFALKPVALTTEQVRYSLEQKVGSKGDDATPFFNRVLPSANLMSRETMEKMRQLMLNEVKPRATNASDKIDLLLDSGFLQMAVINGWLTKEQLGLTDEMIRNAIAHASKSQKDLWFYLSPISSVNSKILENGTVQHVATGYTVLLTGRLASTVQCLDKLGCLDSTNIKSAAKILLQHQILGDQTPPGRKVLHDSKLMHGLFYTTGSDPIRDTYESLIILEKSGDLNQIDRDACIGGILRFYHGKGEFLVKENDDSLVIFGDTRDTFSAFESLRILGGLNRLKDLDQWKFRPQFTSLNSDGDANRVASWDEMEAWTCQQRLQKILLHRKENPHSPVGSLLQSTEN